MKYATTTTAAAAKAIQAEDDAQARLPWPGVYLDGSPAPAGHGVTKHLYDVTTKPDGKAWAYPVSAEAVTAAKTGDPIKAATIVDKLDATWAAVAEAPKEEPIEDPKPVEDEKPIDDFAVPVK